MMNWGDKFNQMTKSAISKSKEMAEITRLNMEISNYEQKMKELAAQIGMDVVERQLLADDEQIAELASQIRKLQESILKDQATIQDIRNINICANCGAEVSRTSKFCDKCGSPMDRTVLETSAASAVPTCPSCGEKLEAGALFCTNCGTKLSE